MASVADTPRRARRYAEETGESLAAQIEGVRDYIESLGASLGHMGGGQVGRARKTALKTARRATHDADAAIHANPYAAIGVAVVLGFLAGVLWRR